MALADVTARVLQIRTQLGVNLTPARPTAASATTFANELQRASGALAAGGASGVSGADVVASARKYLGVPYVFGGNDPKTGLDCSSLVQRAYADLGVKLPRIAADQARQGTAVASLAAARPGDLVFFGTPAHHVGIYAGDGKMVDAPRAGKTVGLHNLWGTPSAIRRVLPTSEPTSGQPPAAGGQLANVPFGRLFAQAGAKHGVDPALLAAVAKAESGFNPRAVSHAGARGLMQLMPSTAAGLGVDDAFDPPQAVDGSARLLRSLLTRFGGRVDLALAGYNAGPGAVQRYGGVPPYAETRAYVSRVNDYWEALR
jgi:soluble lytic murein transglycosylase-like protein